MKKTISILIAISLLSSLFIGCGKTSSNTDNSKKVEKVKITYWHWDGNPTSNAIYKNLIDKFQLKNPNIEVDFVGLPADSSKQKYMTAVAGNSLPDAAGMNDEWIKDFILQDALEPLDDNFNKWSEKGSITAPLVDNLKKLSGNGKLYLLPLFVTDETVWYNSKLLKEKNIEPPKTIAEFMADSQKLADNKNAKYLFSIRGGAGCTENLFDFVLSNAENGEIFDKDGNCIINGPKHIEGLDKYVSLYKNQYTSKDDITNGFKEMVAEFGSGTAMMIYHNSSSLPEHLKNLGEENFMNMMHPTGATGIRAFKAPNSSGPVIFKTSTHKEEAWKLVSYLASAEAASYLCEKEGRVPVNSGIYKEEWYKNNKYLKTYADETNDPNSRLIIHPAWLPEWNNIKVSMVEPDFQAIMLGKKTSKEALDSWAKALTNAQQKYMAQTKK